MEPGAGTSAGDRTRIARQQHGQAQASRQEFEELAANLEAVWHNHGTDVRLKKRIVRTLIEEVIVDVDGSAGEIILTIHWKGGEHTELRLSRRRRGQNNSQTPKAQLDAVVMLARICSDDLIAGILNRNGLLTGLGNRCTRQTSHLPLVKIRPTCKNQDSRLGRQEAFRERYDYASPQVITMLRGNPTFLILLGDALERGFCGAQVIGRESEVTEEQKVAEIGKLHRGGISWGFRRS